ncbi:MAG TPA: flotillin-like FloA family protein, partial [Candidatus Binatia bacterium]|nr:flotillin-like FloA family protein [Candidatus Binatia bacterium]
MNLILAQTNFLPGQWDFVLYGIGGVLLLVFVVIVLNFGMIYIRALFSGAKVTMTELIALRLRRIPAGLIVDNRITAVR